LIIWESIFRVNINRKNLRRYSMGKKIKIRKERLSSFFIYSAIAIWLLSGCATPSSTGEIGADEAKKAISTEQPSFTQNDEISAYQEMQLAAKITDTAKAGIEESEFTEAEPHILFKPQQSDINQVLGIDFTMLEHGKSRLTVTTDKKVTYDLEREGEKVLVLNLYDITIPSLLLREIDTTEFKSALNSISPVSSAEQKEVSLNISLREMVPFHIKQTENGLNIEFGQTTIVPPEKEIIPLNLAEAQTSYLAARQPSMTEAGTGVTGLGLPAAGQQRQYTGERMYLDFVNADVTHILRLINEISDENIIWDPTIKGRTVSMILKDVPWDQALDLILDNNDLAKRYRGDNIIWITTKAKMEKILADEQAEARRQQQAMEEELERQQNMKRRVQEDQPLVTEYLPVDFATADEIQGHITLSDRGTMSIDTRTNTIIIKDTADSIEEARKTVAQFDTPVKQIMIEARIVDASDNFSRDLGIKWNADAEGTDLSISSTDGGIADIQGTGAGHINDSGGGGGDVIGGTFSTNAPTTPWGNIGLSFGRLSRNGLGVISLDASLALAETEGTAKVMSAPKVIAREGTAATISSGDSIIIPATENVASTTLDATLSLTVTPTAVSYNDFITMDVSVTDDQAPSQTRLLRKSISTTLMIKSGETVVIGGIMKESESEDFAGLPVLKDIPALGWLFKAKTRATTKSELLIFLTPTVLPSPAKTF
jgi:type IV pilus assembly protein PilQ